MLREPRRQLKRLRKELQKEESGKRNTGKSKMNFASNKEKLDSRRKKLKEKEEKSSKSHAHIQRLDLTSAMQMDLGWLRLSITIMISKRIGVFHEFRERQYLAELVIILMTWMVMVLMI